METMRKAAEAAETDQFNPAIEAASGADADALQNGPRYDACCPHTRSQHGRPWAPAAAPLAGSVTKPGACERPSPAAAMKPEAQIRRSIGPPPHDGARPATR